MEIQNLVNKKDKKIKDLETRIKDLENMIGYLQNKKCGLCGGYFDKYGVAHY
jgi:hypothetical protein